MCKRRIIEANLKKFVVKNIKKTKEESEYMNLAWAGGMTLPNVARPYQNLALVLAKCQKVWHEVLVPLGTIMLNPISCPTFILVLE